MSVYLNYFTHNIEYDVNAMYKVVPLYFLENSDKEKIW